MSFVQDIADFRDWWVEELRAMLPGPVFARNTRRGPSWTIRLSRETLRIEPAGAGVSRDLTVETLPQVLVPLPEARSGRRNIELILGPGTYLERRLAPFPVPKRRARAMAVLDLQSSTPLDPADVLILLPKYDADRSDQQYFIVKKGTLVPVHSTIEHASAQITAVKVRASDRLVEIEPEGLEPLSAKRRRGLLGGNLIKVGATVCLAGIAATFAHLQWRYAEGLHQLDVMTERLEPDVKAVRILSDQRKQALQPVEESAADVPNMQKIKGLIFWDRWESNRTLSWM